MLLEDVVSFSFYYDWKRITPKPVFQRFDHLELFKDVVYFFVFYESVRQTAGTQR